MRSIWIGASAALIIGIGLDELWRHATQPVPPSVETVLHKMPDDPEGHSDAGSVSQAKPLTDSEVRDRLDRIYSDSLETPTWLESSMQELRQKLASHLPADSSIDSFECRAAMCKIESAHADPLSSMHFQMIAFRNPDSALWNAGFFSTRSQKPTDGSPDKFPIHLVTYLAPPNQSLPIVNNYPNRSNPNNSLAERQ